MFDVLAPENWDPSSHFETNSGNQPISSYWDGTEYLVPAGPSYGTSAITQLFCLDVEQSSVILEGYFRNAEAPLIWISGGSPKQYLALSGGFHSADIYTTPVELGATREFPDPFNITASKYRFEWELPVPFPTEEIYITGDGGYPQGRPLAITGIYLSAPLVPEPDGVRGVLVKDWDYNVVQKGSVIIQQKTTTASYIVTDPHLGSSIPLIQVYPLNPSVISSPGIRLATFNEVEALKSHLYSGTPEPVRTSLFTQLHYAGNYGKPIQAYSQTSYISTWHGEQGLGFYVFLGYNLDKYPTQEIDINSIQRA